MKKLYDAINDVVNNPELADEVAEVSAVVMRQEIKSILEGLASLDDEDLRPRLKIMISKL
tara:strand:- start:182 stop:361 length:180 start_codon:yes stop_codon:yes gene_type:complete